MKTLISKLTIAIILSITLVAVTTAIPQLSRNYLSYRAAKTLQIQAAPEIPGHSYAEMMNTLFSSMGK